jgi:hypothetical protein
VPIRQSTATTEFRGHPLHSHEENITEAEEKTPKPKKESKKCPFRAAMHGLKL